MRRAKYLRGDIDQVLKAIDMNGPLSTQQLREITEIPLYRVRRALVVLRSEGTITRFATWYTRFGYTFLYSRPSQAEEEAP